MGMLDPAAPGGETEARGDAGAWLKPGLGSRRTGNPAGARARRCGCAGEGRGPWGRAASSPAPHVSAWPGGSGHGGAHAATLTTHPVLSGVRCAVSRQLVCGGETEARGLKWGGVWPRGGRCGAAAWLQGGWDPKSRRSLAAEG